MTVLPVAVAGSEEKALFVREQQLSSMPADTAKVRLLLELGRYYCSRENDRSLLYLQQALALSMETRYLRGAGLSYLWQGRVYYYKDEYLLAGSYLARAREVLEKEGNSADLALWHFAMATLRDVNGDFSLAVKEYQEAIRLTGQTSDERLRAASLVSLGSIVNRMNEPGNALVYFREALAIQQRLNEEPGAASTYTNIGAAFETSGHLDSALYYYRKGYQIRLSGKEIRPIAHSEYSLGALYVKMKRYAEAIILFEKAREKYLRLDEKAGLCMVDLDLAVAMDHAGNKIPAHRKALNALEEAKAIKNREIIVRCYETLGELAASNGKHAEAYQYILLARKTGDTLAGQKKAQVIKEMEGRFRLQEANNKLDGLKVREKAQLRYILLLSVTLGTLLGAFVLIILLYRQKTVAHRRQKKLFEQEVIIRSQQEELAGKEQQLLREKVDTQERELAAKALEMLRLNETIGSIIERLQHIRRLQPRHPDQDDEIGKIVREIEYHSQHNAWQEFDTIFRNIHREFYDRLLEKCPDLTAAEIKIAALLKLNLSTKEIAAITLKSEEGIKSTRYRLRKKLHFTSDEHLIPFLLQL